jgi:peptide/nickel transport system permease protein
MSGENGSIFRFILKRILQAIPLMLCIITINFILIHSAPGDPVIILAGEAGATPEYQEMMRARFGLDKPLHEQLIIYMRKIISGDLGYSIFSFKPVSEVILQRIPATLILMVTQLIMSAVIGILLGVKAATKPYSKTDNIITSLSLLGYSIPVFWIGMMGILIFSIRLDLLPATGMISIEKGLEGIPYLIDLIRHLTLPCLCLTIMNLALIYRLTRSEMLEVLKQDYIVTARSLGMPERTIVYNNALKNALLPVMTVIGMQFGFMFAGAILTETIFAWPGLGTLIQQSIKWRDYPLLMGLLVFVSLFVIIANLITDILYAYIDPRIRLE